MSAGASRLAWKVENLGALWAGYVGNHHCQNGVLPDCKQQVPGNLKRLRNNDWEPNPAGEYEFEVFETIPEHRRNEEDKEVHCKLPGAVPNPRLVVMPEEISVSEHLRASLAGTDQKDRVAEREVQHAVAR